MSVPAAAPESRPLPPRPSLEYERREAKTLCRRLRAGDPDAIARARARHPSTGVAHREHIRLADAQLVIAREYGFSSWSRMVHWFGDAERQHRGRFPLHGDRDYYEANVLRLLDGHRRGSTLAGRALAAYVPQFYGMSLDAVFAHTMDDAAARLAVARMHGAPSWQALMERVEATPAIPPFAEDADTKRHAIDAIVAGDLEVLERIAAMHPELLRRAAYDNSGGSSLMWLALGQERRHGPEVVRPAMEWLASRGVDRARELGIRLCGHHGMTPREVHDLLELGADARWIADNGIPVLEHALLRYWNGDAVDVLAAHAPPLKALWIFAGLGDIEGVDSFLDHAGKPTIAARRLRPDFVAVGEQGYMPQLPEADDEELLLEALVAAMVNGRARMIDYLAARGAPVKSMAYGRPLIEVATNNRMTDVAQALARAGG